jgi:hypothetical protein
MVENRRPGTLSSMREVIPMQWVLLNGAFEHMDPLITHDLLHVENAFSYNQLRCVSCRFGTSLFAFRFGARNDYQFCARVA